MVSERVRFYEWLNKFIDEGNTIFTQVQAMVKIVTKTTEKLSKEYN